MSFCGIYEEHGFGHTQCPTLNSSARQATAAFDLSESIAFDLEIENLKLKGSKYRSRLAAQLTGARAGAVGIGERAARLQAFGSHKENGRALSPGIFWGIVTIPPQTFLNKKVWGGWGV